MKIREAATLIRQAISMEQIVSNYLPAAHIKNGFINCPFHAEKTSSLKLYDNTFYCFGCHARGDALDFVGKLFGVSPLAAVERINNDFNLSLALDETCTLKQRLETQRRISELTKQRAAAENLRRERQQAYEMAVDEYTQALLQMRDNAPTNRDAPYPAAWQEAAKRIDLLADILNYAAL